MTRPVLHLPSKQKADLALLVHQWPGAVTEYKFHPHRRWRFDYCWREKRIAVEYEGVFSAKSRHTNIGVGYHNDCEKYSVAAILGWCVIRVTAPMVRDGRAAGLLKAAHRAAEV